MKILITGTSGFTLWNKITDFNAKHYSTGRIGFHLAQHRWCGFVIRTLAIG